MAARLAPVNVSATGAERSGHSVSAFSKAAGVRPDSTAVTDCACSSQASTSSKWRIAVRTALSIPLNQRTNRSAGGPAERSPPAPPNASGAKTAPCPSLAAIRAAVALPLNPAHCALSGSGQNMGVVVGDLACAKVSSLYDLRQRGEAHSSA